MHHAALGETLPGHPRQRVLNAVQQTRGRRQQRGAGAEPGTLGVRRQQQGRADHGADDQPLAEGVVGCRPAVRPAGDDERRHPAREQREARPALTAEGLFALAAREREREQQVRGQQRLDEGDLALAQRHRAERHSDHHEADAAQPARHLHQVEQDPRRQEVLQRSLLGRVLLQYEAEAHAARSADGEYQDQERHAAYLDHPAGRTGMRRGRPKRPRTRHARSAILRCGSAAAP